VCDRGRGIERARQREQLRGLEFYLGSVELFAHPGRVKKPESKQNGPEGEDLGEGVAKRRKGFSTRLKRKKKRSALWKKGDAFYFHPWGSQ